MIELISIIAGRPWAIRADIAAHVRGILARDGLAGLRHLAELRRDIHGFDDHQAAGPEAARGSRGRRRDASTVAVIPIIGTLTQRPEMIGSMAETRSTAEMVAEVRAAMADPDVDAVVLEVDSPGGEVFGVPEAWAALRAAAKAKPLVAAVNSMAASAGYYLASAADEVWVTPSGLVGSVGVYMLHVDASKALEDMGESWEFIVARNSPFKVEGNPAEPLTEEAREALQADVDRYMAMFERDVARGRRVSVDTVRQQFGQGRVVGPDAARSAGMIDQVGTLEDAVRRAAALGQERRDRGSGAQGALVTVPGPAPAPSVQEPAPEPVAAEPAPPEPAPEPEADGPDPAAEAARRLWGEA